LGSQALALAPHRNRAVAPRNRVAFHQVAQKVVHLAEACLAQVHLAEARLAQVQGVPHHLAEAPPQVVEVRVPHAVHPAQAADHLAHVPVAVVVHLPFLD